LVLSLLCATRLPVLPTYPLLCATRHAIATLYIPTCCLHPQVAACVPTHKNMPYAPSVQARFYGIVATAPNYAIVMAYYPRGTLSTLLHSHQELSWRERGMVALQVRVPGALCRLGLVGCGRVSHWERGESSLCVCVCVVCVCVYVCVCAKRGWWDVGEWVTGYLCGWELAVNGVRALCVCVLCVCVCVCVHVCACVCKKGMQLAFCSGNRREQPPQAPP
jgi:hypothetical protein